MNIHLIPTYPFYLIDAIFLGYFKTRRIPDPKSGAIFCSQRGT